MDTGGERAAGPGYGRGLRWSAVLFLLLGIGLGAAAGAARAGEEEPVTLHGWLEARGRDTSFEARKQAFERTYPGEVYRGSAEQNVRWLRLLRGRPAPGPAGSPAARAPRLRVLELSGWRLTLDLGAQVLALDTPPDVQVREVPAEHASQAGRVVRGEPPLHARLPLRAASGFVSAGALALKAKQFDDGLYAAVEKAAHWGLGRFAGKAQMLQTLAARLHEQGACAPGNGPAVVLAAAATGNPHASYPDCVARQARALTKAFLASPLRSKPLGCYTWDGALQRIFRQDRLLQTRLDGDEGIAALVAALEGEPALKGAYGATLRLHARLTNPPVAQDLRARFGGGRPPLPRKGIRFYPPSRSHEVDLVERLWGDRPVPPGANLMDELIRRVQAGSLSLAVRPDSGWYDHQTWALEPLLRPDETPEAARLRLTPGYRKHLVDLFKGVLALTRETHVKQLDLGGVGAYMPPPTFHVAPRLSVEPLGTHYRRRADAYRFVRTVLEEAFGRRALARMRRETPAGAVRLDLDTELTFMTRLFDGAAETAWAETGTAAGGAGPDAVFDRLLFRLWAGRLEHDADVARDARMMVPVFWDEGRRKTKVWVFLGWQERPLNVTYHKPPAIHSLHGPEGKSSEQPPVRHHAQRVTIACPVMAEVYVRELLDRKAFRAHCDEHETRAAILANLR